MKILFLSPYPFNKAPSQRFRFEQYFKLFGEHNITWEQKTFYSEQGIKTLYGNNLVAKILMLVFNFPKRVFHIFSAFKYDFVFIHRELAPIGPPIYEWILKFIIRKPFIYDFDDAIWLSNISDVNKNFNFLKAYWKVSKIIKWADKVTVGNKYLEEFALNYNKDVKIIPSTVDMLNTHFLKKEYDNDSTLIIGWTGSHTTAKYLPNFMPILKKLKLMGYQFRFMIISNQKPELDFEDLDFVQWSSETEIKDLIKIDIGIMPIENTDWEKGKCSFKAIQYMSLGISCVISPYGMNEYVLEHGISGFFAKNNIEWVMFLGDLLSDKKLRSEIGAKAKLEMQEKYSMTANLDKYLSVFKSTMKE